MNINKKVLMSVALFVVTMFGASAQDTCQLCRVNAEIFKTRNSIDSVRNAYAENMTYQMRKNSNYLHIRNNSAEVKKLRRENRRLMTRAEKIIRRKYPMALIPHTSFVFWRYRDIPGIKRIGDVYNYNLKKIHKYDTSIDAFRPQYQVIKNRCDSAMHAQIDMYQRRLDSLLNKKMELVR